MWVGGLIAVLVAGGFILLNKNGDNDVAYRLEKIDRGDIVVSVSATGTLNAVTTVQVGSQVSGTIAKLYADFNDMVKDGQLLAQLDPTFLQATVNEQKANMDRATAQVQEAQRTFDRTSDLFSKTLVSQADMDAATTALESAKASLQQAKAALERAQVNLRYATIRAPISGVVISRSVDVGQTVAASLSAPTLFAIANDLRKMQVQASVDEADIGQIKPGQQVIFRVDAFAEVEFNGVVSQIRLAPTITQNVVTYTVIVDVDNPKQKLMPGMTATLTIEVERREGVLRVPVQATRFTPPVDEAKKETADAGLGADTSSVQRREMRGERRMRRGDEEGRPQGGDGERRRSTRGRLWIMKDGNPQPVFVRRGIQNTQFAEIESSELKEGDEVIVGIAGAQASGQSPQQNPFMPQQMPRGARRGF